MLWVFSAILRQVSFINSNNEAQWNDVSVSVSVSEVLAFRHPFVKTRLLKDGTTVSKAKARKCAEQLLPYKPRPDTCPALARRLVTGALGVKLPTSREEREAEKKILSQARGEITIEVTHTRHFALNALIQLTRLF